MKYLTRETTMISKFAIGLVALTLLCAGQASADLVVTNAVASEDNYTDSGAPDTVQTSTGDIRTKAGPARSGFIKFDLSPSAVGSESATLRLTVADADTTSADSYGVRIYGLNAGWTATGGRLGTDWAETAITWNNAPGWDGGPDASAMTQIGDDFTVTGDTDDGKNYQFSISTMSSFLQADNTATFAIYTFSRTGGNWLDWKSSETGTDTTAPLLTYTVTTAIPEPNTFGLLLIGLAVGCFKFRRFSGR